MGGKEEEGEGEELMQAQLGSGPARAVIDDLIIIIFHEEEQLLNPKPGVRGK